MSFEHLNMKDRRAVNRVLRETSKNLPFTMTLQPEDAWKDKPYSSGVIECWRSAEYLANVYQESNGILRVSICFTQIDEQTGRWKDGISWDDIQRIKREIGRGDQFAVEIYPADNDIVNVANMRHIWILPEPPAFAWRRKS